MWPLLAVVVAFALAKGQELGATVCTNNASRLTLAPEAQIMAQIPGRDGITVFVEAYEHFDFACDALDPEDEVKVIHSERNVYNRYDVAAQTEFVPGRTELRVSASDLSAKNHLNFRNSSVECVTAVDDLVCKVKVVVMRAFEHCAEGEGEVTCRVEPLLEEVNPTRNGHANGSAEFKGRFLAEDSPFEEIVHYSYFDQTLGDWVRCSEHDEDGNETEISTVETIKCPIIVEKPQPVIIRVETSRKTVVQAALPFLGSGGSGSKPKFTYFSVFVNSTVTEEELVEDYEVGYYLMLGGFVGVAVILIFLIAVIIWRQWFALTPEGKRSSFYTLVKTGSKADPKTKEVDLESMATDSTHLPAYDRLHQFMNDPVFADLFADESQDRPGSLKDMDKGKLKTILQRQLSGNPARINPDLSLNQQVNNLSHDPKLEVARENFKVGKLLGSGHFGSVFDGSAFGLLHPGSETKVAIKTVNDPLDAAQLHALLCEMKIMAQLDLHLNLVNLLGSCTSEITENGQPWLLLEFCAHGNMKDFLLNNRAQFRNNIAGRVATEVNARLFVRWSHSVAKGMAYLASKRIMHGDLAARNILLGENLAAKISDFGLSKAMYKDSYKKEKRSEVPWKWMALEFLEDGCFALKSDVWSFGMVVWEMLSLGREPYPSQEAEEVIQMVKAGFRLPRPEESTEIEWADAVYERVVLPSWTADPDARPAFEDVVRVLEEEFLDSSELCDHLQAAAEYESFRELLFSAETVSKRNPLGKTLSGPPDAYHKVVSPRNSDTQAMQAASNGYQLFSMASMAPNPHQQQQPQQRQQQDGGYIAISEAKSRANSESSSSSSAGVGPETRVPKIAHDSGDSGYQTVVNFSGPSKNAQLVKSEESRKVSDASEHGYVSLEMAS